MRHKALKIWLLVCALVCGRAWAQPDAPVTRRALLVGCDAFITHENTAPSARMNVERMARMLQSDARGYASIAREDQGIPDREYLENAVQTAFDGADDNDISLIYFCTHGLYDRISYEPLLVLSDGKKEDSLSAASLKQMLDAVPGRKILILDACNSGAFIDRGARGNGNLFTGSEYLVLTSAGAYENSFLWHDRQVAGGSYFAQELCEGLRTGAFDLNADGTVTMEEARLGLLEYHGASTAQLYPLQSGEALYVYDPARPDTSERPISDLALDSALLTGGEDTLYFSFTVQRPVRVQYQLIYYRGGQWRFDTPQLVEDQENAEGALTPGRKQRAVTLVTEDEAAAGYALLQIVVQEGRYAMLAGSRLISVQPDDGDPGLAVWCGGACDAERGQEASLYVRHAFPCSLTVRILDAEGGLVRRLAYKNSSRPLGERQDGSFFYWDGRDAAGNAVPAGEYTAEITCRVGEITYSQAVPVRAE